MYIGNRSEPSSPGRSTFLISRDSTPWGTSTLVRSVNYFIFQLSSHYSFFKLLLLSIIVAEQTKKESYSIFYHQVFCLFAKMFYILYMASRELRGFHTKSSLESFSILSSHSEFTKPLSLSRYK